uniref:Uncharacterized protein n=1 Tax=Trichuris muris TaxID=70415 RepID=A0A5S6QER1_TRIMR
MDDSGRIVEHGRMDNTLPIMATENATAEESCMQCHLGRYHSIDSNVPGRLTARDVPNYNPFRSRTPVNQAVTKGTSTGSILYESFITVLYVILIIAVFIFFERRERLLSVIFLLTD